MYRLKGRPYVFHDPALHPPRRAGAGTVTFSIDFELSWAWRFSKKAGHECVRIGLWEREQLPRILNEFARFGIPATWATVGHLFLEKCTRGAHGLAHEEMPRPPHFENEWWKFTKGDWYQHDPCSDVHHDPAWYAPDLIESVMASPTGHEIACHSFSHVGFARYCNPALAGAELDACIEAMKPFGLRPVSLVFPGNEVGNFETVAKKGFTGVRWFPREKAEITLPVALPTGLQALHVSIYLSGGRSEERLEQTKRRIGRCIERAAQTGLNAHIWFHPSITRRELDELLVPTLRQTALLRESGRLRAVTMAELARDARAATDPQSRRI